MPKFKQLSRTIVSVSTWERMNGGRPKTGERVLYEPTGAIVTVLDAKARGKMAQVSGIKEPVEIAKLLRKVG